MRCIVFKMEEGIARLEDRDDLILVGPPGPSLSGELRKSASFSLSDLVGSHPDEATYEAFVRRLFCEYKVQFAGGGPDETAESQQRAAGQLSAALRGLL